MRAEKPSLRYARYSRLVGSCMQAGYKLENGTYSILSYYDYLPRPAGARCRLENGVL